MAKQNSPNAARVRDNQRRSRARRKEYTKELEARLREYELKGVKVAQEIQDAARAVLEENKRLKIIIEELRKEHGNTAAPKAKGNRSRVTEELESKLSVTGLWKDTGTRGKMSTDAKKDKSSIPAVTPHPSLHNSPPCALSMYHIGSMAQKERYPSSSMSPQVVNGYAPKDISVPRSQGDKSILKSSENRQVDLQTLPTPPRENPMQNQPHIDPQSTYKTSPALKEELNSTDDSSSCAFAVAILTSMRADVSTEEIKADLGCATDFEKCKIDNKRLFGAVDKYTR